MEEADVKRGGPIFGPTLKRILAKGAALGFLASLATWGLGGPDAAAGVLAGVIVAAVYASGYISGHVGRATAERGFFDLVLIRQALFRIGILGVVSVGIFLVGRQTFAAYLIGFAIAFGVLVISEAGHISRTLKMQGTRAHNGT